jgi:hypothetical protein
VLRPSQPSPSGPGFASDKEKEKPAERDLSRTSGDLELQLTLRLGLPVSPARLHCVRRLGLPEPLQLLLVPPPRLRAQLRHGCQLLPRPVFPLPVEIPKQLGLDLIKPVSTFL